MSLPLEEFLTHPGRLFDVRSPTEVRKGAIPGAYSLPILDDEHRVLVGTCYKEHGRDAAVELGFRLAGPLLADFIKEAKTQTEVARVYCWRGGMRSEISAWLLNMAGIPTVILEGGYKAFRGHCLQALESLEADVRIIGGMTGSGKTHILHALAEKGEQVLDLEGLASHRGSSFGGIGMPPQPSTEQFENLIACEWAKFDQSRPIWIEDESRMIGRCQLPGGLYDLMRAAPVMVVDRPYEERLDIIESDYGSQDREKLAEATERIRKKLGNQRADLALKSLEEGDIRHWIVLILGYYDKTYQHLLERKKDQAVSVAIERGSDADWAEALLSSHHI